MKSKESILKTCEMFSVFINVNISGPCWNLIVDRCYDVRLSQELF